MIKSSQLLLLMVFITISCENRDWANPFDPDCPKEIFTPSGFKAEQQGNLIKLSWIQTNRNISGFKVERNVGDGSWTQIASEGKNTLTWDDTQPTGGKLHEYRIYAYAGNNNSNQVTTQITPLFTATLSTATVSNITSSSVTSGGNISDDGGATITSRGVCWNTTGNPNTGNHKTSDGTGTGIFSSSLSNLLPNTTYYLKAYATNNQGTAYGNEISFTTLANLPSLTTATVSTFTATSAICGGEITNDGGAQVTERGVCWSTSQNPTISESKQAIGSGTGVFSNTITGLTANTTYYVRAYAINKQGTAYGNQVSFKTQPLALATVITAVPSGLTSSGAVLGGNVTSDGNATVTERGVCYSTSQNPTTSSNKTVIGSGTGTFSTTVTGLTDNTTYYARAYAINSQGTAYGSQVSFTTNPVLSLATVTTAAVNTFTSTTALLGGNVTSDGNATITERGVCYSTSQNPTTSSNKTVIGSGTGTFSTTVTGLTANTTYYVRAYAINSQGTSYGIQVNFTTSPILSLATVTTASVTTFTSTTALLGGNVTSDGNATVTERGVCYSTSQNPTTANSKTIIGSGTGTFSTTVTGLTAITTYYVRSYAINSQGTAYGSQVSFTTNPVLSLATVTTASVSTFTSTTAILGGNVIGDGNATVTERGVCYSTSQNPTTASNKTVIESGTGSFSTTVTGSTANTTYYVRAYAINSQGTAYGSQVSFTTSPSFSLATVTTASVSTFTSTTALLGGNVTSDGNATVTERGVCYSTSQNPTTASNKTVIGSGTGTFSTTVTGLTANTTYYVRAYAINSQGTAYGSQVSFTTSPVLSLATVTTAAVSTFTSTTALLGGNVTSDGNATVTERGVCYSTSQNPTTASNKTVIGSGTGTFSTTVTGLTANTTYYVIAYAINSQGTAYGSQVSFTTNPILSLATVTTAAVSTFTSTTALLGGNVTSDGNATVTERGVCYSTSQNPTTASNKTVIESGTGTFSTTVTGLTANTTYYVRAYAINSQGTAYGSQVSFTTLPITDADGNVYNIVTIGTQVWMVENLKTTKYRDGSGISNVTNKSEWGALTTGAYCWYNNNIAYKLNYGALYNWFAVNSGNLCPLGWHVPSDYEWTVLSSFLGGESVAGGKMKSPGGTNESGFTGLPGGHRGYTGDFIYMGEVGEWWTSTEVINTVTVAWDRMLFYSSNTGIYRNDEQKVTGRSVRCIKD